MNQPARTRTKPNLQLFNQLKLSTWLRHNFIYYEAPNGIDTDILHFVTHSSSLPLCIYMHAVQLCRNAVCLLLYARSFAYTRRGRMCSWQKKSETTITTAVGFIFQSVYQNPFDRMPPPTPPQTDDGYRSVTVANPIYFILYLPIVCTVCRARHFFLGNFDNNWSVKKVVRRTSCMKKIITPLMFVCSF